MSQPVHMKKGNNYSGNSFSATYADSVIGTILAYGGTTAPYGWFLCQGQALSRTEYSELFEVIGTSFGAGDGSTTFNLPDLRGEFLRGAGTNSHTNQGNGGTVGEHQDATTFPQVHYNSYNSNDNNVYFNMSDANTAGIIRNVDWNDTSVNHYQRYVTSNKRLMTWTNDSTVTTRPTNTSVNFIIKAKYSATPAGDVLGVQDIRDTLGETPIPSDLGTTVTGALSTIDAHNHYSTSETWTGKYWVDGKKIYGKVIIDSRVPNATVFSIALNVNNMEKLTFWNANFESEQQGYTKFYIARTDVDLENEMFLREINRTYANVYCGTNINRKTIKSIITIEYTKTTD